MEDRGRPGLNNPAIRARLAQTHRRTGPVSHSLKVEPPVSTSINPTLRAIRPTFDIVAPQPYSRPAHPKQQQSQVLRRQSVRKPNHVVVNSEPEYVEPPHHQQAIKLPKASKLPKPKLKLAFAGLALLAAVVGIGSVVNGIGDKNDQSAPVSVVGPEVGQENDDSTKLSELKPTANALSSYSVPADEPKIITIPKLYVYARIKPVSSTPSNGLMATNNIFDAGWLYTSSKPDAADKSVTVINGHSAGPNQAGLFSKLANLLPGDIIKITRGDGQPFTYNVVKVKSLEPGNVDPGLLSMPAEPGKAGLNLVGCDDNQTLAVADCRERVIVYAVKSI